MNREQIFLACLFGVFLVLGYGVWRLLVQSTGSRLRHRLQDGRPSDDEADDAQRPSGEFLTLVRRASQVAGKPFAPRTREEQSALRRQLSRAGIYSLSAMHLISGAKAILLAIGLLGGYFIGRQFGWPVVGLASGGLTGFLIPTAWLNLTIAKHQQDLEHGLPDALDLMVICVESGLTLDAAMQRVGREIALAHPALARELVITHMETQMGMVRADAVRNLGRRTGCAAIQSLAAMLVQAERFGTGIAQALRIHAESLRIKRQHAAEEVAAKASVKMTFPLVLCVFPALLIVVGGPAMILISRHLAR